MSRALVIAVDQYRTWDRSGASDLPGVAAAARKAMELLSEQGAEVDLLSNPTGQGLREAVCRLARAARADKSGGWLVFVGAGAVRADGKLVLCARDADRTLADAVPLDDLAWTFSNEGPERMAIVLDCGFTGIRSAEEPVRTLTPQAVVAPLVRLFRSSDVVIAHPIRSVVPDTSSLVTPDFPGGAIAYEISGSTGGNFIDIRSLGDLLGRFRVYIANDPTVPPPFHAGREYWYWRPANPAWPNHFVFSHSNDGAQGPNDPSQWVSFDQGAFGAASVVAQNPTGPTWRIVRQPAGVEAGYLEIVPSTSAIDHANWYAWPNQIDVNGFFLFGPTERLEFTSVSAPDLAGRTMHQLTTARRIDTP